MGTWKAKKLWVRRVRAYWRHSTCSLLVVVFGTLLSGRTIADLPRADEVLRRIAERAEKTAPQEPQYEFTRTKRTKIFDGDRKMESSEEEVFRMVPFKGKFECHLLSRDGKTVSKEESARAAEHSSNETPGQSKAAQDESMTKFLGSEVANRFSYEVVGEDTILGRPAYVVRFQARPELAAHGIEEKVIARITGKLWVDKEEFEVVRIDSGITKPLRFALGIVGVLHELRFSVERCRLENGQWASSGLHLRLHFRQLFKTNYVEYDETGSAFLVKHVVSKARHPESSSAEAR